MFQTIIDWGFWQNLFAGHPDTHVIDVFSSTFFGKNVALNPLQ